MGTSLPLFVLIVGFCLFSIHAATRKCYKCGCFIQEGEKVCKLDCEVLLLEDSYCFVQRMPGELELGHNLASVVSTFAKSLHYVRAVEVINYQQNARGQWQPAKLEQITYGCDWDLCNAPEILDVLPTSLSFAIDPKHLSEALIDTNPDSPVSCKNCTKCVTDSSNPPCPDAPCPEGTCIVDDHAIQPEFNGNCNATYVAACVANVLDTMVRITGTYYLDDDSFEMNELDLNCRKTNCNDPLVAMSLQMNVSYVQVNSSLFTRPNSSSPPMGGIGGLLLLPLVMCVGYFLF